MCTPHFELAHVSRLLDATAVASRGRNYEPTPGASGGRPPGSNPLW